MIQRSGDSNRQKPAMQGNQGHESSSPQPSNVPDDRIELGSAVRDGSSEPRSPHRNWQAAPAPLRTSRSRTRPLSSDPRRYLRATGRTLQDAAGRKVRLHGINVGGWLVTENWMCGMTDATANADRYARETLESRFGSAEANALMGVWEDHWFTAADLDAIKSMRFNALRVPFGYRNLQNLDGSWITRADGSVNLSRFDWVVQEAGARGLYVVFDLHIWQSQRLNYSLISQNDSTAISAQKQVADIWRLMAKHFAGNSVVAGFDVANEVTGSPDNFLQRLLYDVIRAEDPNRLLILESVSPADVRMKNVMYSIHDYNCTDPDKSVMQAAYQRELPTLDNMLSWNVPLYIGEFMANGDDNWSWLIRKYNDLGVSWSPWTFKTVNMGGWGLINLAASNRVNLNNDSANYIAEVWRQLQSTKTASASDHQECVKVAAAQP